MNNYFKHKELYTFILLTIILLLYNPFNHKDVDDNISVTHSEYDNRINFTSNIAQINSLDELRYANVNTGVSVQTSGYYNYGDGGAATYLITDSAPSSPDDIFVIKLKNGKYANLLYDSNTILNVACAGIFPGAEISDKLNQLIELSSRNKIYGIQFNTGTYLIDKPIKLKTLNYYGQANAVLSVTETFSPSGDWVFSNIHSPSISLTLNNINFEYNTSANHPLSSAESTLFQLTDVTSCTMKHCSFIARNRDAATTNIPVNLLWFKHCNVMDNINIYKCTFDNETGSGNNNQNLRGGCLWFNGPSGTTSKKFSNINVIGSTFTHTTKDECIGLWNGNFNTINISDCIFNINEHYNENVISLSKGEFHGLGINTCKFYINSMSNKVIKITQLTHTSDIRLASSYFKLYGWNSDPYTNTYAIIFLYENNTQSKHNITLEGNEFYSNNIVSYRALVCCKNVNTSIVNIINNYIDANFLFGIEYLDNTTNIISNINGNNIKTLDYIATTSNVNNCPFYVSDNKLNKSVSLLIRDKSILSINTSSNTLHSRSFTPEVTYKSSSIKAGSTIYLNNK
ncbi:MAG: hypothetical protein IJ535_12205 [Pseudobutyrivibrio sp.]|uniref:hypothetical protein n=1 Tax=Pseudobutyrivibrio sp. TaxID=2014367 RepID=UPI0025F2A9A6|nr:hypothetical protein [Pseudobutyrivibrio sp.]MBQ8490534.1 hypothetical protein [Pseudobutyrivibrio sp.]